MGGGVCRLYETLRILFIDSISLINFIKRLPIRTKKCPPIEKKVAKWPPHGEKGPSSGEKSNEKTPPYSKKKIPIFQGWGMDNSCHPLRAPILILIVNWQDSRLSITPMFHSD